MKVLIDMQGAQGAGKFRGIGRYTKSLILELVKLKTNNRYVILLNASFKESIEGIKKDFSYYDNVRIKLWYPLVPLNENMGKESHNWQISSLIRESVISQENPDIVFITSLFEGFIDNCVTSIKDLDSTYTICMVYDFIPIQYPELYMPTESEYALYYKRKLKYLSKADCLTSISLSSKKEAESILLNSRTLNISTGCDEFFFDNSIKLPIIDTLKKYNLNDGYIMYTGGVDPRKNIDNLIIAFKGFCKECLSDFKLLLAGNIDQNDMLKLMSLAKKIGLNNDSLVFTGYISDLELKSLYSRCSMFVFPSLHEGFGLPPLEAMASGAPVITSNTSSLPEVIQNKDAMFNPVDINSIKLLMLKVHTDFDFRESLIKKGKMNSLKFRWKLVATNLQLIMSQHNCNYRRNSLVTKEELIQNLVIKAAKVISTKSSKRELLDIAENIELNFRDKTHG